MQIWFYEAFEEERESLLRLIDSSWDCSFTPLTIQEAHGNGAERPPAPIISTRTQSILPHAWAPHLDAILSRSTGYDHLHDYHAATGTTARLGYLPKYCAIAVAEHAMLAWMALNRRLTQQLKQVQDFNRDGLSGRESRGQTLLVVGVGNIGIEIARLGKAIGMHVLGVDLDKAHKEIEYVDLTDGMALADVVVCAMNLTDDNVGFFDQETLAMARRQPVFVNVSRGELSPSAAVLQALKNGTLRGVAIDVYNRERELAIPLREGRPVGHDAELRAATELLERPDVLSTPHNAFNTIESVQRKSEETVQQLRSLQNTGEFSPPVPMI